MNAARPTFFEQGFRPFFSCASLFAALAVPAWLAVYGAGWTLPGAFDGFTWHVHELVFGFFPAVLTGFLLTASPNWTGRTPVSGGLLASLFLLWLAGRVAMAFGGLAGAGLVPVAQGVDAAFLVVISGLIWREILLAGNKRNYKVCALVSLFAFANLAFHAEQLGWLETDLAQTSGLALIAFFISLIGGRVIPAFTRNWMMQQSREPLPTLLNGYDKAVLAATAIVLIAWVGAIGDTMLGAGFLALAILHAVRLGRWSGWKTASEPLVLVLHAGYGWLVAGFLLLGLAYLVPGNFPYSSALHALTAGGIGTMTLAIMSRASLGHSGRPLQVTPATLLAYILVSVGTVLRVAAFALPFDEVMVVTIGGLVWSAGFLVFFIAYRAIFMPRLAAAA